MKGFILSTVLAMAAFASTGFALPTAEADPEPAPAPVPEFTVIADGFTTTRVGDAPPIVGFTKRNPSGTFQAFYGSQCDSGAGSAITYDSGTCSKTLDRHSYTLNYCANTFVSYCSNTDCTNCYQTQTLPPGCYNVNTHQQWGSTSLSCY